MDEDKPAGARTHNIGVYHEAVRQAMKEVSQDSKSGGVVKEDRLKKTPVVLVVSSEGIRVVETGSREMRARVFIEDIEFTTEVSDTAARHAKPTPRLDSTATYSHKSSRTRFNDQSAHTRPPLTHCVQYFG